MCLGMAFFASQNVLANCDTGEMVLKFSHVTNATKHPKGIAANLFAQRVNKEMNGKVCMQIFPNSTLYNDNKVLEALLNGDVHFAAPSLSKFEKFTKKFRIFDLPFLFEDIKALERFQKSRQGQKLLDSMTKKGLKGLVYWHNGMKQLSANRPLIKPEDAKGLKFRVQSSDVLIAQFRQLKASPQKMAFKEVYGALQTGVVDGQENTWSNIYGKKFFEVQDGITESNHGVLDYLVVTSTKWWQGLDADIRNQLAAILQEVTALRNSESILVNRQNRDRIIAAGSTIRLLNNAQRQAWVDALKPVWQKFEKNVGKRALQAAIKSN
ncbi:TRAP-type C4-dicarboxylate transport system, periplasmic component [uncultured Candidatus Thioglobus sp.]|nr:TRAP-type C4-dicarboxylate transport system, periplasmic component [uncultured Candidatus Thioglobus sp.]